MKASTVFILIFFLGLNNNLSHGKFSNPGFSINGIDRWEQTNGPGTGEIKSFCRSSTAIYATGSVGGVFRSSDNGQVWKAVNGGLPSRDFFPSITCTDDALILATSLNGVYRSTNEGQNWISSNSGIANMTIESVGTNGNIVFAGTSIGVYRSTNNGISWAHTASFIGQNISCFSTPGSFFFAGTKTSGVFRTTNNGDNWTAVNNGIGFLNINTIYQKGSDVYAGTDQGIYVSTNNGANWTLSNSGMTSTIVVSISSIYDNLLAGTFGGVFHSTNNGQNWSSASSDLLNLQVYGLLSFDFNLLAGTVSGTYFSSNNGASWNESDHGIANNNTRAVIALGNTIFAGGVSLLRSTDFGDTWSRKVNGLTSTQVYSLTKMDNRVFAGTGIGAYRSDDLGENWIRVSGLPNTVRAMHFTGSALFAGTNVRGVYKSTNGGLNWFLSNSGMTDTSVFALASIGTEIFAGTLTGVFRSTDNGQTWDNINNGLPSVQVSALYVWGGTIYTGGSDGVYYSTDHGSSWTQTNSYLVYSLTGHGTNLYAGTKEGFLRSTDYGSTWNYDNNGFDIIGAINSLFLTDHYIFAGTLGQGVWRWQSDEVLPVELSSFTSSSEKNSVRLFWTTSYEINNSGFEVHRLDATKKWQKIGFVNSKGGSDIPANYSFNDDHLSSGKYEYRLKQLDYDGNYEYYKLSNEVVIGIPDKFSLSQNYPNPFNPATTIGFELPYDSKVTIELYDILGKKALSVINEQKAAGYYKVTKDFSGLSSGIYYYRIFAESERISFTDVKKLMIIK